MKSISAVIGATVYLIIFIFLCATGIAANLIPYLFILSPFLMIAMVITVLTDTTQSYPELGNGKEWGYLDKPGENA